MNKFIGFFVICAASNVFAQSSSIAVRPVVEGDLVEFVNVEQMPVPIPKSEIEKLQKASSVKSSDGTSTIEREPEKVRGFFRNVNTAKTVVANRFSTNSQQTAALHAPELHKDLSTLKLTFNAMPFSRGALIAAAPSGTLIGNAWTGVERFFRVEDTGTVQLTEYDLGATKGKFYMLKDAVNTRVNGKSAISKVFTDADGQSVEEIVWVNGSKLYMLIFGPDVVVGGGGTKVKVAPHVTALSLAQELR